QINPLILSSSTATKNVSEKFLILSIKVALLPASSGVKQLCSILTIASISSGHTFLNSIISSFQVIQYDFLLKFFQLFLPFQGFSSILQIQQSFQVAFQNSH